MNPGPLDSNSEINSLYHFTGPESVAGLKRAIPRATPSELDTALNFAVSQGRTAAALLIMEGRVRQEGYNFALQAACDRGNEPLTLALLHRSSIISVSRSLIKSASSDSVDCMRHLFGRLDAENGWIPYDNAIALSEGARRGSARCLTELAPRSCQGAKDWALREAAGRCDALAFRGMIRIGANPDGAPPWNAIDDRFSPLTARQTFELSRKSHASERQKAEIESIELEMEMNRPAPREPSRTLRA